MLPVPTVAARQVISAWNGLISPLLVILATPCQSRRKPTPRRTRGMNFNPSIRYRPVPRISTSINGPRPRRSGRPPTSASFPSAILILVRMNAAWRQWASGTRTNIPARQAKAADPNEVIPAKSRKIFTRKPASHCSLAGRLATEQFHQPVDEHPHPRRQLALRGIHGMQRQRWRQPFAEHLSEAAVSQAGGDVIVRRLDQPEPGPAGGDVGIGVVDADPAASATCAGARRR